MKTTHGPQIVIPKAYKHMMPKKYTSFEDKLPILRRLIETHQGEVMPNKLVGEAINTTAGQASGVMAMLVRKGYVTRQKVKVRRPDGVGGYRSYTYTWNETPLQPEEAILNSAGVVSKSLGLPKFSLKAEHLESLTTLFAEWIDTLTPPINGEQLTGVVNFRKWLADQLKATEAEREQKLNDHATNSNNIVGRVPRTEEATKAQ
jgi:hypothetical protein